MQLPIVVHFDAKPFRFGQAAPQIVLARFLQDSLIAERLFLTPQFLAHPFESGAQSRQHGLLPFQRRCPLIQLGDVALLLFLLLRQPFRFAHQTIVPFVELRRLLFQIARIALQLLVAAIHFQGTGLQLFLSLFQRRLNTIEPDEIGLVLLLSLLQRGFRFDQFRFARLHFLEAFAQIALHFLLPADDEAMLLFEQLLFALHLFAAALDLDLFLLPLLLSRRQFRLASVQRAACAVASAGPPCGSPAAA